MKKEITEIERIRRKFKASRKQFGLFIGKSESMIKLYENGKNKVPEKVLKIAYMWESFFEDMKGK